MYGVPKKIKMYICIKWLWVSEIETVLVLTSYIGRKINMVIANSFMLTQRATYEMSLNHINKQRFYYSLCNTCNIC